MLTATWNQPPALRQGAMAIRFVVRAAPSSVPSSLLSQERLTRAVALPSPVVESLELGRLGATLATHGYAVRTACVRWCPRRRELPCASGAYGAREAGRRYAWPVRVWHQCGTEEGPLAVRASWARERVHAQRVHCTAAARGRRRGERAPARSAAERHPTSAAQGGGESPKVHDRIRSVVAAGAAGATRSCGPCSDGQRLIVAAREAAAHHSVAVQPPAHRCSGCGGGHRGQLAVEGDPGLTRPVTALPDAQAPPSVG